jgi:peptidoglycan/xylan/chitin deacetylase (PgdA/CDA1 family)
MIAGGLLLLAFSGLARGVDVPIACQREGDVALTFDGGPSMHTGLLLATLQRHNVKATFHIQPHNLDNPVLQAYLKRAANDGHLIGLHIADLRKLPSDLALGKQTLKKYANRDLKYVRLPTPLPEEKIIRSLTESGMIVTAFNFDSMDYQSQNRSSQEEAEGCIYWTFKDVFDAISPPAKGSFITVQRDMILASVKATDGIIEYAKNKGYRFVRLDECLQGVSVRSETVQNDDHDDDSKDDGNHTHRHHTGKDEGSASNDSSRIQSSLLMSAVLSISILFLF